MKILSININDLVDNKIDIIFEWAVNNFVSNIYILSGDIDKDKLTKIISKLPKDINVSFFLDSTSSYELSGNDIKDILKDRKDIKFISDMMVRFEYENKVINLVNDLIEKDELIELLDSEFTNYNIFILRDKEYDFNFRIVSNMKAVFVSIPNLNDKSDFVLLENKNNIIIGSHIMLRNNTITSDILFKV